MSAFPVNVGIRFDDAGETPDAIVVRSKMERGLPRTRRVVKFARIEFSGTLLFLTSEIEVDFKDWYYSSTGAAAGAAWFDWTHPKTEQVVQARFVSIGKLQALDRCFHVSQRQFAIEYMER